MHADEPFADLDEYIGQEREQWKVPGLSIAIVKDGEVVLARGFGVCRAVDPLKSAYEAFTAQKAN